MVAFDAQAARHLAVKGQLLGRMPGLPFRNSTEHGRLNGAGCSRSLLTDHVAGRFVVLFADVLLNVV